MKSEYNKQFRGSIPRQPPNEYSLVKTHEADPAKVRKRQGVAVGAQTQANPGIAAPQGMKSKKRRK